MADGHSENNLKNETIQKKVGGDQATDLTDCYSKTELR